MLQVKAFFRLFQFFNHLVLQVKALAAAKDWEGLELFAVERKSPIGLEPFVAACRSGGAPDAVTARWIGF